MLAALKPLVICSSTLQNTFLLVQHPKKRVWGRTTDHSGPKNPVFGYKMAFFGHLWAKNVVFLVMAARKRSILCSKILQNTIYCFQHPQTRVEGPTTAHSGPKNTVLGKKMTFFGHFGAKNAVFW